ncbi:MAG: methyltransferase [Clostridia bacterium]|nr:methyltransferase [Clostridia bacterium]
MINSDERINEINESLRLIEKTNGLVFGTDAYLLASYLPKRQKLAGAELGCGTGVISLLAMARKKCRHVYAFEVQKDFCDLTERNIRLNGFENHITVIEKNVKDALPSDTDNEVDFVFTNPPYMKSTSGRANEHSEKNIARHEVCGDINDFCACAKRLLKHGGAFYAVYRPDRMSDLICAMRDNGIEPKKATFIYPNSATPPCLMLITGKKGAKSGMIIERPVFIYKDGTAEYTDTFSKIYENCSMYDETEL